MTDYFLFDMPLTIGVELREVMAKFDDDYYRKVYRGWVNDFIRRTRNLCMAQLSTHSREVMKEAMRYCDVDNPDLILEYYHYELKMIERDMGYEYHDEQVTRHLDYLDSLRPEPRTRIVTSTEAFNEFVAMLESPLPSPDFIYPMFDRVWFNRVMIPGLYGDVSELRRMPYPEYLKTMHWRAIRAAMMMLHGARCQSEKCGWGDSWWFGGEHDLNVHHLTYKNRGQERYEDLLLLCRDCHEKVHRVGVDTVMKGSDWHFRKEHGLC